MLRGNAFTITCFVLTIATNLSHSSIDPTIWMCVDGEVDTAVRTRDGSTYMFMSYWFWKLNDRLDGVVGNASLISHEWQHLYNNIETAFYMSGNSTPMTGKTFFIQDNKWFQFTNQVFEESGNVENWTDIPSGDLLVISQPNNPIIGVYEKHVGIGLVGYYFDKPLAPETIWMCVDGEVDTAVRTRDGSTYMFMSYWFWKLNDRLDGVVGNASLISHEWQHLYNNIETAFYMSGNSTPMTGKTFFIQDNKWLQFANQVFEESGNVENWTDIPSGDLLVISQPNNPIIGVYEKHVGIGLVGYYFDKPLAPEVRHIVANTIPFDLSETCAVIAYDDGSYLVFYDDTKVGRNCRIVDVNRGIYNYFLDVFLSEVVFKRMILIIRSANN
ncbi:unnamed protein product [Medioppia subpectinata]|uniref:Uncharacterized protein n=1 Tax=Medioppia subpectinata TaxID=1979941 RepID=A0A7R9KTZ7_9ACAR|nr:unnamed protein product [Medioppia subpectinata]CAG2109837.1 unnamed protein product [Medioppia subpectinata]